MSHDICDFHRPLTLHCHHGLARRFTESAGFRFIEGDPTPSKAVSLRRCKVKDKDTIRESHDPTATIHALAECDLVCHLAADPEVRIGAENIDSHFRENLASRLFCSAISSWPGRSSPCARSRSKRPKTKVRVIDLAGKSRPSITDLCYARNHQIPSILWNTFTCLST